MVIKEELLKGIEKLSPKERLKRLKEIEEQIKLEERITEEIIVKEKETVREKTEADEMLEDERRKKKWAKKEKELEQVVEAEKVQKQEEELAQVQYHAKLITDADQKLNQFQGMGEKQRNLYQDQAKDIYDDLSQAYAGAETWMKDDIRREKERIKKMFGEVDKWWEDTGAYVR